MQPQERAVSAATLALEPAPKDPRAPLAASPPAASPPAASAPAAYPPPPPLPADALAVAELHQRLQALGAVPAFGGAKLDGRDLSPGCQSCGEGTWSCLFLTGQCNATCFYCPTSQDTPGLPTTGGLEFEDPDEYVDYIEMFGFRGVGLSGGEPLLRFDQTLHFAQTVKARLGSRVHLWLYTNGKLATNERLDALAGAGLDEIRFDVSAGVVRPGAIAHAVAVLPRVTVEIPAEPGDLEALWVLARDLADLGVRHLNLHQLRATEYNRAKLEARGLALSSTVSGQPDLAEGSEPTALALMARVLEQGLPLSVNACTWRYKSAAQARATRLRAASHVLREGETVDDDGVIHGPDGTRTVARIVPRLSYRVPFVERRLPSGRKIAIERWPAG